MCNYIHRLIHTRWTTPSAGTAADTRGREDVRAGQAELGDDPLGRGAGIAVVVVEAQVAVPGQQPLAVPGRVGAEPRPRLEVDDMGTGPLDVPLAALVVHPVGAALAGQAHVLGCIELDDVDGSAGSLDRLDELAQLREVGRVVEVDGEGEDEARAGRRRRTRR